MNCRLNAMQDSSIEDGVGLPEVQSSTSGAVEIIGYIDGLGRSYIEVGDKYVRVGSLTNPKLSFAPRIPRIIDVTPLGSNDEQEAFVESIVQKLLPSPSAIEKRIAAETAALAGPAAVAVDPERPLGIEEELTQQPQEPSTEKSSEQGIGLHGD